MARQGNTTAIGLGWAYRKKRAAAIKAMPDGTRCQLCGRPMFKTQKLHYDHVIPRALGGVNGPCRIVHATCNIRAGAILGNRMRHGQRRPQRAAYNRW